MGTTEEIRASYLAICDARVEAMKAKKSAALVAYRLAEEALGEAGRQLDIARGELQAAVSQRADYRRQQGMAG